LHTKAQRSILANRLEHDLAGGGPKLDAVADCVLHQRLQDEAGHQRIEDLRPGRDPGAKAVLEADPLDLQITLDERELLVEGHLRRGIGPQRSAEQITQASDHPHCIRVLLGPNQRSDGMQRVEEEVRAELHLQRLELGAQQLCLETRGRDLALMEEP
jgi:hypothetical protein